MDDEALAVTLVVLVELALLAMSAYLLVCTVAEAARKNLPGLVTLAVLFIMAMVFGWRERRKG